MASGLGAAWADGGYRLFAQRRDGKLQESSDGISWIAWEGTSAVLPSCCTYFDTGLTGQIAEVYPYGDNSVEVETGNFLGDGRKQVALAYRKSDTQTGVALFSIEGGFHPKLLSHGMLNDAVDASIATGDFLGQDGLDDAAVAYVLNHSGGVKHGVKIVKFIVGGGIQVPLSHEDDRCGPGNEGPMKSTGTVKATAGDYDGDGQEEIGLDLRLRHPIQR